MQSENVIVVRCVQRGRKSKSTFDSNKSQNIKLTPRISQKKTSRIYSRQMAKMELWCATCCSCWIIYCVAAWSMRMRCDVWPCGAHTKKIYLPNKLSSLFVRPQIYLCEETKHRRKKMQRQHQRTTKLEEPVFHVLRISILAAGFSSRASFIVPPKSVRCSFIFIASHFACWCLRWHRSIADFFSWCCVRFSVRSLHTCPTNSI